MNQEQEELNFPAFLFHKGLNFRSYSYFGVHRTTDKYIFRLWAPKALKVFLLLYFRGKKPQRYEMQKVGENGAWEVAVQTVKHDRGKNIYNDFENICYRYKIVTENNQYVRNDPFSRMFSVEKNSSVVSTRKSFFFDDLNWSLSRTDLVFHKGAYPFFFNMLRVDLFSFARDVGLDRIDYRLIAKKLVRYVKSMKYSHVLFSLVNQSVRTNKGNCYSQSLFSPFCYPGAIDDFKYLVNKLHRWDIAVAVDFAPSFFVDMEYGLSSFIGDGLFDYEDDRRRYGPEEGIKCFDLGRDEVVSYLNSAAFYWLEELHVDVLNIIYPESFYNINYEKERGSWIRNRNGGTENLEGVGFLFQLIRLVEKELPDRFVITDRCEYIDRSITPCSEVKAGFKLGVNSNWISDFSECFYHFRKDKLLSLLNDRYILPALYGDITQSKESLIKNMLRDGDVYAVLRVIKVLQMTLPGKKYEILGDGLGQSTLDEFIKNTDHNSVEFQQMKRYTRFVRSINWLYFLETSFYENDFCGRGFSLINVKHENVLAFKRISTFRGDRIVLINFSPDFIDGVVVPSDQGAEYYETIFNSNEKRFGGRGGTILAKYRVRKRTWDFTVHLPPLCAVVLKPIVINY